MKQLSLKRNLPLHPNQYLSFSVDIAPSVNHMYIGRTKKLTKTAEQYIRDTQQKCVQAMKEQNWQEENDDVWYHMNLWFYFPDRRIRDSHNCIKLLLDCFEGILYKNDYFVMPCICHVTLDKENPRIEVTFKAEEDGDW